MNIVVIDGQGGRMGCQVIEAIRTQKLDVSLTAVGTNALATAAMLKAGASRGATGENPVVVACRDADVVIGPIGILAADSLLGEVTEKMAVAVGRSQATKLLLPVNQCRNIVVGTQQLTMAQIAQEAAAQVKVLCEKENIQPSW